MHKDNWTLINNERNTYLYTLDDKNYKIIMEFNPEKSKVKLNISGIREMKEYFEEPDLRKAKEKAISLVLKHIENKCNYWNNANEYLKNKLE